MTVFGVCTVPELRFLMEDAIGKLSSDPTNTVHLYCRSRQEADFYQGRLADIVSSVSIFPSYITALDSRRRREAAPDSATDSANLEQLRGLETEYGLTLGRMMLVYRQLGHGYLIGGSNHPTTPMARDSDIVDAACLISASLEFWDAEIKNKDLEVIVNALPDAAHVARRRSVAFRYLRHARHENYHYWSDDEYANHPAFVRRLRTVAVDATEARSLTEPYWTEIALRRKYKEEETRFSAVSRSVRVLFRHAYWRIRGYSKARESLPIENLKHIWRTRRQHRLVTDEKTTQNLETLFGQRFVFFPLQTEPEATLHHASPEFFFQIEAIQAIARALPDDVTLAVKETLFAVGRRPDDFYRRIAAIPNVVILSMWERGVDVVREASAVATITSTVGLEALIMGKPAILFGRHNFFGTAPHARVVLEPEELESALDWALDATDFRPEGAQLLKALIESSFSLGGYDYLDLTSYTETDVEALVEALIQSLDESYSHYPSKATARESMALKV